MMITREQLEERRSGLEQSISQITHEITELDTLRNEAYANLQALSGARQLIDELLEGSALSD